MGNHGVPPHTPILKLLGWRNVDAFLFYVLPILRSRSSSRAKGLLPNANFKGCAESDQLLVYKLFFLLLLALLRRAHSNGGNVDSVIAARAVSACRAQHRGGGSTREFSRDCQRRPHNPYYQKVSAPAAVQTPPHPHFCLFLALSWPKKSGNFTHVLESVQSSGTCFPIPFPQ